MRQISVLACLSVLLAVLGCDVIGGGKACFLRGERIDVVADANGDEWPVTGEDYEIFGESLGEVCAVSRKSIPYRIRSRAGYDDLYVVSESGEQLSVEALSQFHWMINRADWIKPPEGWE